MPAPQAAKNAMTSVWRVHHCRAAAAWYSSGASRSGGLRPTATSNPCRMASGGGGFPGTATSTGRTSATPLAHTKLFANTPPDSAHAPTAITRFGVGIAFVDLLQREPHLIGHGTDDQQHVRMARRRRDEKSEPVHVVIRIVELLHLVQACAAVACVHHKDVDGPPEWLSQLVGRLHRRDRPFVGRLPVQRVLDATDATVAVNTAAAVHRDGPLRLIEGAREASCDERGSARTEIARRGAARA